MREASTWLKVPRDVPVLCFDVAFGWVPCLCRQGEEASFEPGTLTGELLILATAANQLFQSTQDMSPDAQVGPTSSTINLV